MDSHHDGNEVSRWYLKRSIHTIKGGSSPSFGSWAAYRFEKIFIKNSQPLQSEAQIHPVRPVFYRNFP